MRLTTYTDYSLRMLIYLGLCEGRLVTIQSVSAHYGISRNHLMKVANGLVQKGYVAGVRGKNGGLVLARAPEEIVIGDVVRDLEGCDGLVECFDSGRSQCRIDGACALKGMLGEAQAAFMAVLDGYTLADIMIGRSTLALALFGRPDAALSVEEERLQ